MDHFNVTIRDGVMVSTKRGLQVSKSNHQGIRFVNTYAAPEEESGNKNGTSQVKQSTTPSTVRNLAYRFRLPNSNPRRKSTCAADACEEPPRQSKKGSARRHSTTTRRSSSQPSSSLDETVNDEPTITAVLFPDEPSRDNQLIVPSPDTFRANVWETHEFGFPMTTRSKKMVHVYFSSIPSKMYPLENILTHNPARTPAFLDRVNRDVVIMRCIAGTGLIMESLFKGLRCSDEILQYMAELYGLINKELQAPEGKISMSTVECICSMAIGATHIGQYDHWRLHMKGLQQITTLQGEALQNGGYLMNKLRRADVKGAAIVGELPFLQYRRLHENVSNSLPLAVRKRITRTIESVLLPCGIQGVIIDSITGLAIFASALRAAFASPRTALLDPHGFIDEWYWVELQLLRFPGPLCDPQTPAQSLQMDMAQPALHPDSGGNMAKGPIITKIRMPPPQGVVPMHADNLLDPVVRLAGVLYIEALVPDEPRTLNGYAVLLTLMSTTIQNIMKQIRRQSLGHKLVNKEKGRCHDGLPDSATIRPVMIWAALVAYVIAWLGDREVDWGCARYDRSVYRDCLIYFVGPNPENVDLLDESDMALCRVLDVQGLLKKELDDRELLKAVLRDKGGDSYVGI